MQTEHRSALLEKAAEAATLLQQLANPDRLLILCMLAEDEKNVGEISTLTGITQPTLSQQLTVLRKENLVQTRRSGKYVYYRLSHPDVLRLMQSLYDIFCAPKEDTHDN